MIVFRIRVNSEIHSFKIEGKVTVSIFSDRNPKAVFMTYEHMMWEQAKWHGQRATETAGRLKRKNERAQNRCLKLAMGGK